MPAIPDTGDFSRLITALGPWLDQVVVIGGWAHRLYRLDPRAQELNFAPLMTLDADVAMPAGVRDGTPNIRELLREHGFEEDFRGDDVPPATHYRLGDGSSGFYAEFLTLLIGSSSSRSGKRKATQNLAGVNTQQLRYVDLLLRDPWVVRLPADDFHLPCDTQIQVANPVNYLTQKLLIHAKRDPDSRAKDILYIHDTLQVFGARLEDLREEWDFRTRPQLSTKARKTAETAPAWLFGTVTDSIRVAATMAVGRRLAPESVHDACAYGLQQIMAQKAR